MELTEELPIGKCSMCHKEINMKEDIYYRALDNFLQVKYFDSEAENLFCSKECFCDYMQLEEYIGDDTE